MNLLVVARIWMWMMMVERDVLRIGGGTLPSDTAGGIGGEAWLQAFGESQLARAYRLACFLLGNSHEAEDVTQEALAQGWERRHQLRDAARGQAWFDRILVNACRQRFRRRRPTVSWLEVEPRDQAARIDPFATTIARDTVLRAMAGLDFDHRLTVVLRYWADMPLEAISELLGIPVGTVKSRLHYALRDMKTAADGGPPEART